MNLYKTLKIFKNVLKGDNCQVILTDKYSYYSRVGRGFSSTPRDVDPEGSSSLIEQIVDLAANQGGRAERERKSEPALPKRRRGGAHLPIDTAEKIASTILLSFGGTGTLVVFLRFAGKLMAQWLQNRALRQIRIKIGDIEVEVKGTADIGKVISTIERLDLRRKRKDSSEESSGNTGSGRRKR